MDKLFNLGMEAAIPYGLRLGYATQDYSVDADSSDSTTFNFAAFAGELRTVHTLIRKGQLLLVDTASIDYSVRDKGEVTYLVYFLNNDIWCAAFVPSLLAYPVVKKKGEELVGLAFAEDIDVSAALKSVYPISSIGKGALAGNEWLTTFAIPSTVQVIKEAAFKSCSNLKQVTFDAPSSLVTIEALAFSNCYSLSSFVLPSSVKELGFEAFASCSSLREFSFSQAELQRLPARCFYGCSSLTSISLPEGLNIIGEKAFQYCSSLEYVYAPKTVVILKRGAFVGCEKLSTFDFGGTLEDWCSINFEYRANPMFYADKVFIEGKVPEGIVIPNTVQNILPHTFEGCQTLKVVTLQSTVETIGDAAFAHCPLLKQIHYAGTSAQFNTIKKASNWCAGSFADVVHCADVDVPINSYDY